MKHFPFVSSLKFTYWLIFQVILSLPFFIFLSLHILETNFSVQVKTVRYYCEILRAYFYFYDFKMFLCQNKLLSCIFFIPFNHYFYANRHCLEPFNHKMQ